MAVTSNFPTTVSRDLFYTICGEQLGSGQNRTVYAHIDRPDLVIKMETTSTHFQNITEYERWQEFGGTELGKRWLAPIERISGNGIFLFQKRTTPVTQRDFPEELPEFLRDLKVNNFGWYKNRLVCHDYGTSFNLDLKPGTQKLRWKNGEIR